MRKNKKNVYYDKKSDILWLVLRDGEQEDVQEVSPGINIELGKKGEIIGIEILNASKLLRTSKRELKKEQGREFLST